MSTVEDFYIRSGDRLPDLVSTISPAGGARDWAGATWHFYMWPVLAPLDDPIVYKVDAAAAFDAETLNASYQFALVDVDTPGLYYGRFQVTYSDGKKESFPNDMPHIIRIGR